MKSAKEGIKPVEDKEIEKSTDLRFIEEFTEELRADDDKNGLKMLSRFKNHIKSGMSVEDALNKVKVKYEGTYKEDYDRFAYNINLNLNTKALDSKKQSKK